MSKRDGPFYSFFLCSAYAMYVVKEDIVHIAGEESNRKDSSVAGGFMLR